MSLEIILHNGDFKIDVVGYIPLLFSRSEKKLYIEAAKNIIETFRDEFETLMRKELKGIKKVILQEFLHL